MRPPHMLALAAPVITAVTLAAAPPNGTLFSSYEPVELKLTAPFNELFEHGRVVENNYTVTGSLGYGGRTIDGVTIALRGHTSIRETECVFPKLKVQIPQGAALDGTPLAGQTKLKIGTHCGDVADNTVTAKYGRLASERAPYREALVYRLLDALEIPALKARPARVTYVFADARAGQTGDQPLTRNAFLLEDSDDAVVRLGGAKEIAEPQFTNAGEQFTTADTVALTFAQAMIGNFDWCLKMTPTDTYRCNARHPLWNIIAIAGADGKARPVMYDFDVAGMVAGRHRWFKDLYNEAFVDSRSQPAVEVLGQLQRTRTLFPRPELDAARARFSQRKAAAYAAVDQAPADEPGKQTIRHYLDAFFEAIASDEAFYRPAVIRATTAYTDAGKSTPMCGPKSELPVGTIVSAPKQTSGGMVQVIVLDSMWKWAPPTKCPAVHTSAVWIDASAVSKDYPGATGTR